MHHLPHRPSWRPTLLYALVLCFAALAAPTAMAGSAEDPELTDPAADQEVARGPLVLPTQETSFNDIDILAAWVATGHEGQPVFTIATSAPPQEGAMFTLTYRVDRGPTSLHTSVAEGTEQTLRLELEEDQAAAEVSLDTDFTTQTAVGGDLVTIVSVRSWRNHTGDLPQDVVGEDDQSGSDAAGPATQAFAMPREPVRPGVRLAVQDAEAGVLPQDNASTPSRLDASAPFNVTVRVTNTGTDADEVTLEAAVGAVSPAMVTLPPGVHADVVWHVPAQEMDRTLTLQASSQRGASGDLALDVGLPSPPGAERAVVPAGLSFLTGAAETLGLDRLFGGLAELALMALLVLLALLVLYLALTVAPNPWEAAGEAPAAPRPERDLLAGARLPADDPGPGIHPGRRSATLVQETSSRPAVRSADRANPHRSASIRSAIDSLGDDGARTTRPARPRKAAADPLAAKPPLRGNSLAIRVREITHEPENPRSGDTVETRASVENESDSPASIRLALLLGGRTMAEEDLRIGPGAVRPVRIRWQAGPGGHEPRLEVQPGD